MSNDKKYPVLEFNQYNSKNGKDKILMFNASAEDLFWGKGQCL